MKAIVTYVGHNGEEEITLGDHKFGFGGPGDGYCYGHQSFDCLDHLSPEERAAIQRAEASAGSSSPESDNG